MTSLPSEYLRDALNHPALKLRAYYAQTETMRQKADKIMKIRAPSRPSVVMAAIFYLTHQKELQIAYRSQRDISSAFGCTPNGLRSCVKKIKELV